MSNELQAPNGSIESQRRAEYLLSKIVEKVSNGDIKLETDLSRHIFDSLKIIALKAGKPLSTVKDYQGQIRYLSLYKDQLEDLDEDLKLAYEQVARLEAIMIDNYNNAKMAGKKAENLHANVMDALGALSAYSKNADEPNDLVYRATDQFDNYTMIDTDKITGDIPRAEIAGGELHLKTETGNVTNVLAGDIGAITLTTNPSFDNDTYQPFEGSMYASPPRYPDPDSEPGNDNPNFARTNPDLNGPRGSLIDNNSDTSWEVEVTSDTIWFGDEGDEDVRRWKRATNPDLEFPRELEASLTIQFGSAFNNAVINTITIRSNIFKDWDRKATAVPKLRSASAIHSTAEGIQDVNLFEQNEEYLANLPDSESTQTTGATTNRDIILHFNPLRNLKQITLTFYTQIPYFQKTKDDFNYYSWYVYNGTLRQSPGPFGISTMTTAVGADFYKVYAKDSESALAQQDLLRGESTFLSVHPWRIEKGWSAKHKGEIRGGEDNIETTVTDEERDAVVQRLAIGITDITISGYEYSQHSIMHSKEWLIDKTITQLSLETSEIIPKDVESTWTEDHTKWIKHEISMDGGQTWRQIKPLNYNQLPENDNGRISDILYIDSGASDETKSSNPNAYIDSPTGTAKRVHYRTILSRPEDVKGITPALDKYSIRITTE